MLSEKPVQMLVLPSQSDDRVVVALDWLSLLRVLTVQELATLIVK